MRDRTLQVQRAIFSQALEGLAAAVRACERQDGAPPLAEDLERLEKAIAENERCVSFDLYVELSKGTRSTLRLSRATLNFK